MVSKLKPTFVTDEFIGAVADSLATGNAITLTTAVASATTYTDAQLSGLNYAGSQSATKNLTTNLNSAVVKADTNTIVIDVDLVNQNLNSDFQIATVLINATYKGNNILVGVVRFSEPELFPAYDNVSVYELEMKLYISVSRIADATINVNSAGMATAKSVQDLRTYVDGDFNADIARKTKDNIFTGTNTFNKKIIAPAGVQGNADSATKLQTARQFNGVPFDGTADILLDPTTRIINSPTNLFNLNNGFYYNSGSTNTNAPADATAYYTVEVIQTSSNGFMVLVDHENKAYWTTKTSNAWQSWKKISDDAKSVHNSGDEIIFGKKTFSDGIIASLTGNADTATKLKTARLVGGVPFDGGSNIDLPGVNKAGNQDTSGRAANATNADHANNASNADLATKAIALQTPRKINGTTFDGTADINVNAANDSDIVHKSGNENVNGAKTFNDLNTFKKPIQGGLGVRYYPLTTIAALSGKLIEYSGKWGVTGLTDLPHDGYAILTVYPFIDNGSSGVVTLQYTSGDFYFSDINGANVVWKKVAKDNEVMHLYGDETAAGFKKFSGNIATTSDNSMINGGGNNGDLAMVKTAGSPAYLAVGNVNPRFIVRQSNNAAISPSDTFSDMFTVDVSGEVRAGLQRDLVPLDKNVAHNNGNETWSGNKIFSDETTFNKLINGALKTREATFTDFATVAADMFTYSGNWFTKAGQTIANSPFKPTFGTVEVIPGDVKTAGKITFTPYDPNDGFIYYNIVTWKGLSNWQKIAKDETVVHNTGKEDIFGMKSLRNGAAIYQGLELFDNTPYIDFHYNNDTADYTSRIIETDPGSLWVNNVNFNNGKVSGELNGNASSATKLATPRNINGVGFDGTSDITVDPSTHIISIATDIFQLANGFYLNAGVDSTNKPAAASNWFGVEVIQTAYNGFMRLIDNNGLSFWTTKSAGAWGAWHQDADDSTVVHNSGNETVGGDKNFTGNNSFTQLINGALNSTRLVPFTDFSDVANGNMLKYAGFWFNQTKNIQHTPTGGDVYWTSIEVIPTSSSSGYIKVTYQITGDVYITGVDNFALKGWYKVANDSTIVHNTGDETVGGNKNFTGNNTLNGVTTVNAAKSSSPIKKTITTSAPISLNFVETAFGVMVYASASGTFTADSTWKILATLPTEISAPVQTVTLNDVGWAGVPNVSYRIGVGLKIAIQPNREITYKVTSLKENDNTTYNVGTDFDLSTYWSK